MISVNPIDDYTWGAAAYSVRAGRCYLIVSMHDCDNPEYGSTMYGSLAPGESCLGTKAIPANATSNQPRLPEVVRDPASESAPGNALWRLGRVGDAMMRHARNDRTRAANCEEGVQPGVEPDGRLRARGLTP
jgi:hypothetical protein